ncbi:MAG TPA: carboxypeptidase-like regulatory domain-containing protein [Acidobacteriaceae bacterium]|nr:carboxypeptidase-like regulatory domain-containing protein [Acidobacteriaceae bacterium]
MGIIRGTVTAPDGDVIVGALVTLVAEASKSQRTVLTDTTGDFNFTGLSGGTFQLTVTSRGFAPWAGRKILLEPGQNYQVPPIVLAVATASTTVTAVFTGRDLAEHQVHVEEKQRVLGIVPNFYTSYVWNAEPLTSKQKFQLAWRTSIDPVTFLGSGVIAGIEQWQNDFSGYGPGIEGYAKRYGANYADGFIGVMIGGAILPSILHQDPRYFYKGTGSIRSRALYAISTTAICKGDNGQWQPNYSNVLGTVAAAGISNAYYPANDRGVLLTIDNSLIGLAAGAGTALLQEFLLRKISRGVPASADAQP